MKLEYFSNVVDGVLQKNIKLLISEELKHFEGKRVKVTIERATGKRSSAQNRMFHMWVGILSKELGIEFEEMKDILKFKFLQGEKVLEATGEVVKYLRHTSHLSKLEFADLCNAVMQFSAELGVILPTPADLQDQ